MKKRRRRQAPQRPYVLALDTSTFHLSAAVTADDALLAEVNLKIGRGHSADQLRVIDQLIADAKLTMADLDALVVSLGPGSFTGLRVGLALMKGLSLGFGKPLYGASSLDAIALPLIDAGAQWACACIDARKSEVYAALYKADPQAPCGMRRVGDEVVCPPEAIAELTAPAQGAPTTFAGTGAALYAETIQALDGARVASLVSGHPRALALSRVARSQLAAPPTATLATLEPRYIRPSDAEIHLKNRA